MEVTIENKMTKRQAIAGFVYLPFHFAVFPLLLPKLGTALGMADSMVNVLYYSIGLLFVAAFMMPFLRRCFDFLIDNTLVALLILFSMFGIFYVLSFGLGVVAQLLELPLGQSPNDQNVEALAQQDLSIMKSLGIFIAPIVEEVLFRGVLFGSIRARSKALAYVVSIALFSLFHVWEFAYVFRDWGQLIFVIQYIPVSFALAYGYEKTGCIWLPIAFHMINNAAAFAVSGL